MLSTRARVRTLRPLDWCSMSMDPAKLRDEVLRLPLEVRARLVDDLLRSLDDGDEVDPSEYDAAWGAEISERLREVAEGEAKPVPWSAARQRITRES
jgi:putative addiction module component (TIGR02574 family)